MIERDARKFLKDSAAVRNAVSGCYCGHAEASASEKFIVLRDTSSVREYTLSNEAGLTQKTLQVDCYAETAHEAEEIFQVVRNRLSGYRGEFGDGEVESVMIISEGALPTEPEDGSDNWRHRYYADFSMRYRESVPTHT